MLLSRHGNQGDGISSNVMMCLLNIKLPFMHFQVAFIYFKTIPFNCLVQLEKLHLHPDGKFSHVMSLFSF